MKAICPKNKKHKTFYTTAHEVHDWKVDEHGEFIKDEGCSEISAPPDPSNSWTCATCGAEAKIEDDGVADSD
jgi:hypothetical protein